MRTDQGGEDPVETARAALLAAFEWSGGHADVWRVLRDPGASARRTPSDYRGRRQELSARCADASPGDRLPLVDDWAETGSSALTVTKMVTELVAEWVGLTLMVDQMAEQARTRLPPVTALVSAGELPPP